jgi:tRNA modification GTPase
MEINSASKDLLKILAKIEREIDFSDDEITDEQTFSHDMILKTDGICEELKILIQSNKYRSVINDGISTRILGEPNARQSSMLNLLLEEEPSIVSKIARATRDIVSEKIITGSNGLRICDTAGLRNDELCEIEKTGIAKTILKAKYALLIINKTDLPTVANLNGC